MKQIVIANYRSGGFSLHDKLLKERNCYTFKEIFFNPNDVSDNLNEFNIKEDCIAKLCPTQLKANDRKILTICYELCEMADDIVYMQRQNTTEQVISFAVANSQFSHSNITPWLSDREPYDAKLTDEKLDKSFNQLNRNHLFIKELYKRYKGTVYTLEKDFKHEPYPNKYTYKGNWKAPYDFTMLGDNNA
jgi:hypothetical protein